jgi:predicted transcriptional regulator
LSDAVVYCGLMPDTRQPREKVAIRLSPEGLFEVDRLAEVEHRTRSDMIRVLLIEAIAARRKRGRTP